jgi:hypothetical protein
LGVWLAADDDVFWRARTFLRALAQILSAAHGFPSPVLVKYPEVCARAWKSC